MSLIIKLLHYLGDFFRLNTLSAYLAIHLASSAAPSAVYREVTNNKNELSIQFSKGKSLEPNG